MRQSTAKFLLCKVFGWKMLRTEPPEVDKCIILGASHTCVADFFIYLLYIHAMGDKGMKVMVKKEFFKWPVRKALLRAGAIPVDRSRTGGASLVRQIEEYYATHDKVHLAIAPEGTRKPVRHWKLGFHAIARAVGCPVYLGYFDWPKKEITYGDRFDCTDDAEADLRTIQRHYKKLGVTAYHPEKFVFLKEIEEEEA